MKWLFMASALAIAGLLGWTIWKIPVFESNPKPAASFNAALEMFEKLRSEESRFPLSPEGESRLLHHGKKTDRAFVLLHGLTNCPEQFARLAAQLHAAGHNVVVPRARLAGFRDRLNGQQGLQTAQDLIDQAAVGLDLAAGLGDRITLVGLSGSAVAAAWMAQNRDGIDQVAIMAPFFGAYGLPTPLVDVAGAVFSKLPNFYVWWDPDKKDSLLGPPHAYPRFGTRCMADSVQLSRDVRESLVSKPLRCRRAVFITTACDVAADNSLTRSLTKKLASQGGSAEVVAYEFPAELDIPHDMIDPEQPEANTPLVYPRILDLLGVGANSASEP
jgi:carboxylesterase